MNGRPWIRREDRALRTLYPHIKTEDVVLILGRSLSSIYGRASTLGLSKSPEFNSSALSGRLAPGRAERGAAYRFPKGHVPANKGLRRPGWAPGRMRETQFKKGQWPANRDPHFYVLGALRVNSYGYIDMRVSFEPGAAGWRGLHIILWEDAYGPIPPGHRMRFLDGDSLNVELTNLEMETFAAGMRRNSVHNLPPPLAETVRLLGTIKRTINRRTQAHEKQDRRSAQSPV
jgi:hypothetical protein